MRYGSFPEALVSKVKNHPDKIFLIEGEKRFTFHQHMAAALSFANRLEELGLKRGDKIIICTRQTISCLNAFMAAHLIGAVIVPLEGGSPIARVIEVREAVKSNIVVDDGEANYGCTNIDISQAWEINEKYKGNIPDEDIPGFPSPDDIFSVMFTTGTTGKSKGAVLTVDGQVGVAERLSTFVYEADDVVLCMGTFCHTLGIRRYQMGLLTGCTLVLPEKGMVPKPIFDAIRNNHVNSIYMTPSHALLLLNYAEEEFHKVGNQLRVIELLGSSVSEQLRERLVKLFPDTKLAINYGSTETGIVNFANLHDLINKKGCIGRPAPSMKMYIGDCEGNPVVGTGKIIGHICVSGRGGMKEYFNEPELTASILKDGVIKMSDLGYEGEDGLFYYVCRADDVIVSGAYKISPQEIEDVALQMTGVIDCACVPVTDKVLGKAPKLLLVMSEGAEFRYKDIYDYLAARLDNALLPRYIEQVDKIPRTTDGKILRKELIKN